MCKIRGSEKDIRSLRLLFYNWNWCKTYFFLKIDFLIGKIDDELYFDVKTLFLSFYWQVRLGDKKLFTLVTYSHVPCRAIWSIQILFVRREKMNPTQKSASKSDDAPISARLLFATIWKCQFISERLLRLLKSSESINLREGYAIFEDFKNAIKTMIKTGYIKSSISI